MRSPVPLVTASATALAVLGASLPAGVGITSALTSARAELAAGEAAVLVESFDFVDHGVPGTNTAVDVFAGALECLAEGPADLTSVGLAGARLTGRLTGTCVDTRTQQEWALTVDLDLAWEGTGRVTTSAQRRPDGLGVRAERAAAVSGTAVLDAPGAGLEPVASPTGTAFDLLAAQVDLAW